MKRHQMLLKLFYNFIACSNIYFLFLFYISLFLPQTKCGKTVINIKVEQEEKKNQNGMHAVRQVKKS